MDKLLYLYLLLVIKFTNCHQVTQQVTQATFDPKISLRFLHDLANFVDEVSCEDDFDLSPSCPSSLTKFATELRAGIYASRKSGSDEVNVSSSTTQLNNAKCQSDCEPNEVCFVFSTKSNLANHLIATDLIATCLECQSTDVFYFRRLSQLNQLSLSHIETNLVVSPNSSDPLDKELGQNYFSPLNWIILIYICNSLFCTLIVSISPGYSSNKVFKSFDIVSNLGKLTAQNTSNLTKIQFINSMRVISLVVLLIFHTLNPVYSSLRLYFYADYFSFVKKPSLATANVVTIVTAVNLALTSAMFTVIWLPNLRKEDGFMSFCSFLALRFVKTKSAMLTMALLIRSLPNYATGGRSIFIFIQRVTAARAVTWYHKTSGLVTLALISRSHDFLAYTGIFLFVKYLYKSQVIAYSFANLFVITLMAVHGMVKNTFDFNKWSIFSLNTTIIQLTYFYIAINLLGMSFGFLLSKVSMSLTQSKAKLIKNLSLLLLVSSLSLGWAKTLYSPLPNFISSSTVILSTCASVCGLLLVSYNDRTSIINRLSSHKLAVPVTRIFYSMLLAHPFVDDYLNHNQQLAQLQLNFLLKRFLFILSLLPAGLLMNLLVEAPFYNLSNLIMYSGHKSEGNRATKNSNVTQIAQEVC